MEIDAGIMVPLNRVVQVDPYVKELCVINKYEKLDLNVLLLDLRMSICYVPRQVIFVAAPFYRKEENDKLACRRRNKNNPWE